MKKWLDFIAELETLLPTMEIERPDQSRLVMEYAIFLQVRREHRFARGPQGWRQAVALDYSAAMTNQGAALRMWL